MTRMKNSRHVMEEDSSKNHIVYFLCKTSDYYYVRFTKIVRQRAPRPQGYKNFGLRTIISSDTQLVNLVKLERGNNELYLPRSLSYLSHLISVSTNRAAKGDELKGFAKFEETGFYL